MLYILWRSTHLFFCVLSNTSVWEVLNIKIIMGFGFSMYSRNKKWVSPPKLNWVKVGKNVVLALSGAVSSSSHHVRSQVYVYPNTWWLDFSGRGLLSSYCFSARPVGSIQSEVWRLHSLHAKFIRGHLHVALEPAVHAGVPSQGITSHPTDKEPQPLQWPALVTPNVAKPGFHSQAFKSTSTIFSTLPPLYLLEFSSSPFDPLWWTPSFWISYTPLKTLRPQLVTCMM